MSDDETRRRIEAAHFSGTEMARQEREHGLHEHRGRLIEEAYAEIPRDMLDSDYPLVGEGWVLARLIRTLVSERRKPPP